MTPVPGPARPCHINCTIWSPCSLEAERQIPVVFLQASECAVSGQAHEAVPPEANAGYLVQPDEGRHRAPNHHPQFEPRRDAQPKRWLQKST